MIHALAYGRLTWPEVGLLALIALTAFSIWENRLENRSTKVEHDITWGSTLEPIDGTYYGPVTVVTMSHPYDQDCQDCTPPTKENP